MTQILIGARCGGKTMRFRSLVLAVSLVLVFPGTIMAGNPDSTAPPDSTFSLSLEDLYLRLMTGANGTSVTFTEPTTAPGTGTMHTIDEIMAAAPAADNTSGARPEAVLIGQTFWGLRTDGTWGLQTGTLDPTLDTDGDGVQDIVDSCENSPHVGDLCWGLAFPPDYERNCLRYYLLVDADHDGCHEEQGARGVVPGCDDSTPSCFSEQF